MQFNRPKVDHALTDQAEYLKQLRDSLVHHLRQLTPSHIYNEGAFEGQAGHSMPEVTKAWFEWLQLTAEDIEETWGSDNLMYFGSIQAALGVVASAAQGMGIWWAQVAAVQQLRKEKEDDGK